MTSRTSLRSGAAWRTFPDPGPALHRERGTPPMRALLIRLPASPEGSVTSPAAAAAVIRRSPPSNCRTRASLLGSAERTR
jgi:hypothetical protein